MLAHNTGVVNCSTKLFFCLDSDDYILDNTIEDLCNTLNNIKIEEYSGIISVKCKSNGEPVTGYFPDDIKKTTLYDLYFKYGYKGDTMLVFRTDLLRKHLFPKIEGEKFMPEAYVYDQIDQEKPLYILNKGFYICEYLEDGYTANFVKIIKKNPKGYMLYAKQRLKLAKKLGYRYRAAAQYALGCILAKEKNIILSSGYPLITLLAYPAAVFIYFRKYLFNS